MQQTPKFEAVSDARKFFVDHKDSDGKVDGKMMVNLRTAAVVVTTAYGDRVAFTKTNKGKQYRDSRGKKVVSTDSWGNKMTTIRPLSISESEVKSELSRLLGDDYEASRAFRALQV